MEKINNSFLNRIASMQNALICAIVFFLPLGRYMVPLLIIGFTVTWIAEGNFAQRLKALRGNYLAYVFMLYYILHVMGMLYSGNTSFGWLDLEMKLSFLLMPFLFVTIAPFSKEQLNKVFFYFILGNFAAVLLCLSDALYMYTATGEVSDFFYGSFSLFHHPTYFSMYLVFSIAILGICLIENRSLFQKYDKIISILILSLFMGCTILLSAKSGLITLLITLIILTIYYTIGKKNYLKGMAVTVAFTLGIGGLLSTSDVVKQRINNLITIWNIDSESLDKTNVESNTARLLVWPVAIEIIKENWLIGTGTGDIKDVLVSKYKERGFEGIQNLRLNAHNQFLQSFAALGLLGGIALLVSLIWPLIISIRNKQYVVSFFLLIIFINALTESILETQAGIVFYAFFNSLLVFHVLKNPNLES